MIGAAGVAVSDYFVRDHWKHGMKQYPRIGTKFSLMNSSRMGAYRTGSVFAAAGFAYSSWSCVIKEYKFLTK